MATKPHEARALLKRAKKLVSVADKWRDSAEKVLYWAKCSVDDPGESAYNDKALALVHRCFKVRDHTFDYQVKNDLAKIKKCFRSIAGFCKQVREAGKYRFLTVGPANNPDDIAYAVVGGWKSGDTNGLTFVIKRCKSTNDETLTDIIMHESVHFAGGVGHAIVNGKPAYGAKVFTLSNAQALKNASSYAYLAYLARMPHAKWLTAT